MSRKSDAAKGWVLSDLPGLVMKTMVTVGVQLNPTFWEWRWRLARSPYSYDWQFKWLCFSVSRTTDYLRG